MKKKRIIEVLIDAILSLLIVLIVFLVNKNDVINLYIIIWFLAFKLLGEKSK